jgi:hypothetical protein
MWIIFADHIAAYHLLGNKDPSSIWRIAKSAQLQQLNFRLTTVWVGSGSGEGYPPRQVLLFLVAPIALR